MDFAFAIEISNFAFSPRNESFRFVNLERGTPKEGGWAMIPVKSRIDEVHLSPTTTGPCDGGDSRVSLCVVLLSSCTLCSLLIDSKF